LTLYYLEELERRGVSGRMDHSDLYQLISDICTKPPTRRQEDTLARLCIELAKTHLQIMERQGRRIRETKQAQEYDSLAADCVADLFAHDTQGRLVYFARILKPLIVQRQGALDLLLQLRRLITHRVRQHLTRIYRQRDPESAKLLRNIRLQALRHPRLKLEKTALGTWLIFMPASPTEVGVWKPALDLIERAARQNWNSRMDLEKMLLSLFHPLSRNRINVAIPVAEVVRLVRVYRTCFENRPSEPVTILSTPVEDYLPAFQTVLGEMADMVKKTYIEKHKLTLSEGLALVAALHDYLDCLTTAVEPEDSFFYIKNHWPGLSAGDYQSRIRTIYEYLLRQMKAKLAANKDNIFPK
jgi:hypothetical protein